MANAITIPSNAFLIPVNLSSSYKTFTLPTVSTNSGRMLIFKDMFGNAANSSIRLSTLGLDRIERSNVSSMALSNSYGAWTFMNDGITNWFLTNAYLNNLYVIQQSFLVGPMNPLIYLAPTGTFPTYTTTSAPTFGATFVTFSGTNQFLDFGSQVLPMGTVGFSVKMKLEWTAFQNWSRVFDFNSGDSGNLDTFLAFPGTSSNPLTFRYKVGGEEATNYGSNFTLNTIYNISIVYNPAIGSVGQVTMWVNGSNVVTNTSMGAKATDRTNTRTFIGRSSYSGDTFLASRIYFLGVYNRVLTDAEASQVL